MPQKDKTFDEIAYIRRLVIQQDIEAMVKELEQLSSRELYDLDTHTNVAKYLIKRPSEYAMHGAVTNYTLDPVETVEDILIDGVVYYKVGDWQHVRKDDFVFRAEVDHWTGEILYILTCYPIDDGKRYYWQSWSKYPDGGGCTYIQYYTTETCNEDVSKKLSVEFQIELPYMPWVAGKWKHSIGLVESVRTSVIRLEAVYQIVSSTNNEGRMNFVTGVDDVKQIKEAPLRFGKKWRILPNGSDAKTLGPADTDLKLLRDEKEWLWEGIEKSTGVVSVDKLTVLSGESRTVAEKPLIMLAEDVRVMFNKLLMDIYELVGFMGAQKPTISYKPLTVIPYFPDPEALIRILDDAVEKGDITEEERKAKKRYMLDLDENK